MFQIYVHIYYLPKYFIHNIINEPSLFHYESRLPPKYKIKINHNEPLFDSNDTCSLSVSGSIFRKYRSP